MIGDMLVAAVSYLTQPTWHLVVFGVIVLLAFAAAFVGALFGGG